MSFLMGLLAFHFLYWLLPFMFILFVVVPWFMGLVNGKGYGHNLGEVGHGVLWVLSAGFKKRPQKVQG
jgi:hypothetical protein